MDGTAWIALVAVTFSAVSAGAAVFTLRHYHAAARQAIAWQLLHQLEERSLELWSFDLAQAEREFVSQLTSGGLQAPARAVLAVINALDLIAYAVHRGLVERELVDAYVVNWSQSSKRIFDLVDRARKALNDPSMWRFVTPYLIELKPQLEKQRG